MTGILDLLPKMTTATMPHPKQHIADANRRKRRQIVKAIGKRQFKKIYRSAQA